MDADVGEKLLGSFRRRRDAARRDQAQAVRHGAHVGRGADSVAKRATRLHLPEVVQTLSTDVRGEH